MLTTDISGAGTCSGTVSSAITLFSGGGIADIGLKAAGFKVVGAVERDGAIADLYALNHGKHIINAPVDRVNYQQFQGIDLIHASPPCNGFSCARSKKLPPHCDNLAGLGIIRAVQECRPKWVTLENVPPYARSAVYQQIYSSLWEIGYWISEKVVNCADYGVPQNRKRLIMIASKSGLIGWPIEENHRGWYEAIADLLPDCPITELANWQKRKLSTLKSLPSLINNGNDCLFVRSDQPSFTLCTKANGIRVLIPRVGCRNFTLISHNKPCPTIRALGHDRHWRQFDVADNFEVRMLTPRCAARLMSVNDSYILPRPNWLAWKILGNGFPSLAMEKIARTFVD